MIMTEILEKSKEVIEAWRATAMIKTLKMYLELKPREELKEVCDNYLKFIEEIKHE